MHTTMNNKSCTTVPSQGAADVKPWYVSDRRIRTRTAALEAAHIAERISTDNGGEPEPEEQALFAALHTCAFRLAQRINQKPITQFQRILWGHRWQIIRDHIAEKNLGLVHLISRRFRAGALDEDDLLSEGLCALGRAVERFNPWRGFRFSTYACNVMIRSLSRRCKVESRYRRLFPVQHDASHERPTEPADERKELRLERLQRALDRNLGELSDLEARIISQRFPADRESGQTFVEIGRRVGLSKERVRQIQNVGLKKLRLVLELDPILQ